MGYQACFVLPKEGLSTHELIELIRNDFRERGVSEFAKCTGTSVFFCTLNAMVYPEWEHDNLANCTEFVVTEGDRQTQIKTFKGLELRWILWELIAPIGPVGPMGLQGRVLQHLYEKFVPISKEVGNADESEALP
jgi:hypothetical protein